MKILGIETSCDETAAAVVKDGQILLSSVIASSMALHVKYGGVVPEIAARSQIESIRPVIEKSLEQAKCRWDDIDGLAVTYGPGLSGSLLVGVLTARTLAIIKKKPVYGVNHVEAHIYANFLTQTSLPGYKLPTLAPKFPLLALIVSGGHTQLVVLKDHFKYRLLGQTLDDAVGEAFDKVAKLLGLPYPGGPSIQAIAKTGDAHKYLLPKAQLQRKYDFSFSGPKTAVLRLVQQICVKDYDFPSFKLAGLLNEAQRADIAASFQHSAIETVVDKTVEAYKEFSPQSFVVGGGVASNADLRRQLSERLPLSVDYTDPKLCTDNGAMIASLGCCKAMLHQSPSDPYSLAIAPNLSM